MDDQVHKDEGRTITIIINGREIIVTEKILSYEEIINLAFDNPPLDDNTLYDVSYRKGHSNNSGTLISGDTINVHNGMIFDVVFGNKS